MTRILFLIGLLCIAIISSAQETQKTGLPPNRTSDKSLQLAKTVAVLPIKNGGNKAQTVAAQAAPVRKGSAGNSSGQSAANNAKTGQRKTTQSKVPPIPSALPAGKMQQQAPPPSVPGKS
jgi:hypothetical protein